ncbi:MAG: hypothetical protein Tsb002_26220 [Wenzhouxiangellaceae bacterium]
MHYRLLLLLLLLWRPALADEPDDLIAVLDGIRRDAGVAAMAVVRVDAEGWVDYQVRGLRDWQTRNAVSERDYFRIGSVSKLFVGMAALIAQQQGALSLDRPLREWLQGEWYDNPWEQSAPLTLAHLLEHTAGWHDMSRREFDHNDPRPASLVEALHLAPASRRSQWPPGRHSEYSNSGAGLAALAISQAVEVDFESYVKHRIFEPLGMNSATYRLEQRVSERLVRGYDRDGRTAIPYWHILYRPAGGINLVPRDMAPLLQMLLRRGRHGESRFLSEAQVQRLQHPRTTLAARHGLDYGYGLGIYQSQHRGHSLFGHGGDADGYLAHLSYSPAAGRGYFIVITAFNHAPLRKMKRRLNDWLVADLKTPEKPPLATTAELQRLVGEYQQAATRFARPGWRQQRLRVALRGSGLVTIDQEGDERPLLAVDQWRFRRPWETTATAIFIAAEDGGMILQGGMGNWRRPAAAETD